MTRRIDTPRPGWFVVKLVKGGPPVPALIFRPCPMVLPLPVPDCYEDGEPGPEDWCRPCRAHWRPLEARINDDWAPVDRVWTSGREIDRGEYEFLMADYRWARQHAPSDFRANPDRAIDVSTMPPVF